MLDRIRAWLLCAALALYPVLALAQSPIKAFPPGSFQNRAVYGSSAPAAPTWTDFGTAFNNSTCTFVTTCTITTTANVTSGTIVVAVAMGASTLAATGVNACGAALTIDRQESGASWNFLIAHGTVTGSATCTIDVTTSVNVIRDASVAWGTLNNLASSTPGTSCGASFAGGQAAPYNCTGGLTVGSGGFGIVAIYEASNFAKTATVPGGSNVVLDATLAQTGTSGLSLGLGHVTATCTAAQCGLNMDNFMAGSIAGEPFL